MIDKDLLSILACPETHQPLREAGAELVAQMNARIAKGEVKSRAGSAVTEALQGGLVRQDGKFLYPIRDGIPVLLVDEGLELAVAATNPTTGGR